MKYFACEETTRKRESLRFLSGGPDDQQVVDNKKPTSSLSLDGDQEDREGRSEFTYCQEETPSRPSALDSHQPTMKRKRGSQEQAQDWGDVEDSDSRHQLAGRSHHSEFSWRRASSPSSMSSSSVSLRGAQTAGWYLRQPNRKITTDLAQLRYQVLEETQSREACEKSLALLKEECNELEQQNEVLRQEVMKRLAMKGSKSFHAARSLQSDNAILVRQLEDQSISLSSVTFDSERYKACLESHSITVPQSLYDEVSVRTRIPRISLHNNSIPDDFLNAAGLTVEEKANFSSIQTLVNAVNELQVRLRESRVSKLSISDERVAELKSEISQLRRDYQEMKESADLMKEQYEEEIKTAVKKSDALSGKLASKDMEIETLKLTIDKMKEKELQLLEELKVDELEEKIASLAAALEERNTEVTMLRNENSSLTASSVANQKELDYYQTSLTRERHQCDSLRTERDSLYSELHNARSMAAQHSTGTILLQSRISLLERAAKNREAEIEEWRLRFSEAQQKAVEEQSRWDRALQDSVSKVIRAEMETAAAGERAELLSEKLREKEKDLAQLEKSRELAIREHDLEIKSLKNSILVESSSKEAANSKIDQLERQLETCSEERQILASRLESVEAQANILKNRHPQLDFGVMEDELRRFEAERLELITGVEELKKQLEDSRIAADKHESLTAQLRANCESQKTLIAMKEGEMKHMKQQMEDMMTKFEETEKTAVNSLEKVTSLEEELSIVKKQLDEKEKDYDKLRLETEALLKGESENLRHLKLELEESKRELSKAKLDVESISQGHRLEIQAHFRDLQRLESTDKEYQAEKARFNKEAELFQTKLRDTDARILALSQELSDSRRKAEIAENQRRQTVEDNKQIRQLLHDKLDNLELSGDDVKLQLAQRIRVEESLRREADKARVESERAHLELKSSQAELHQLQIKLANNTAQMEKLQEEKEGLVSSSLRSMVDEDSQARLITDFQVKVTRLENELKHTTELKRTAERRFNELITESEPRRRQEALLQGELVSVKNLLEIMERDAQTYKNKYLELTKGIHQDLEVQKAELEKAVKLSESKKLELETALAQTNQNLSHVNAERLTLRNELEKMTKETGQIKSQLQTAQLQLESFQAERPQVEIQKKYQQQVSNFQKLIQQVNQEKEQLRSELATLTQTIATKQSHIESMEKQLHELQQHREQSVVAAQAPHVSPEIHGANSTLLASLSDILDEAVKVGVLSSLLANYVRLQGIQPPSPIQQQFPACPQDFPDRTTRMTLSSNEDKNHIADGQSNSQQVNPEVSSESRLGERHQSISRTSPSQAITTPFVPDGEETHLAASPSASTPSISHTYVNESVALINLNGGEEVEAPTIVAAATEPSPISNTIHEEGEVVENEKQNGSSQVIAASIAVEASQEDDDLEIIVESAQGIGST